MADAVVLVAHGSRSEAGTAEMTKLATAVAGSLPSTAVRIGYLELSNPPASEVVEEVISQGARQVVVVPLMLHAAGHSKSDVPAVVLGARQRHPDTRIVYGRPFGADHELLALGRSRLEHAGALGLPLAVLARGSSDPDANAEAYRASRLLADMTGAPLVAPGFSGITWPTVPDALRQLAQLGASRIAAFAWFIATGVLIDRMREDYVRFTESTGIEVVDGGYLGTGPTIARLVLDRIEEAEAGRTIPNCDACAYRRPFPGLEGRVGQALGTGHSHLAAEHRHHHPAVEHAHHHDHGEAPSVDRQ